MTELLKNEMDAGIIIGGRDTAVVYETWISANILQIKSAGQMQHIFSIWVGKFDIPT